MKFSAYTASVLIFAGVAVASQPAFSQGAMGPGGAPMAPQPRVAAPPQPPAIAPQVPVVVPQSPMAIPSPANPSAPSPQQNKAFFEKEGMKEQLPSSGTTGTSKPSGEPARAIVGGTAMAAPKVLSPANGATVAGADPKAPVAFRWTPLIPRPQEPVTYRLRVWQLMQGQNGTQAMQTNQPVVTADVVDVADISIGSPSCAQKTCSFIWSVQALNRDGKAIGGNNGTSEASAFTTAGTISQSAAGVLTGTTLKTPDGATQASSQTIFDRWGSSFASSTSFAPLPKAGVTSSGGGTSASVSTQTNDKGVFTVGAGQNGQETRAGPITSITISLPANPDANMKTAPPVLVGLGLSTKPFTIKGTEQQAIGRRVEVAHVFPGSVLGKTLSIKVTKPDGSGDATVDWGDGSPSTNIREGKPMAGTVAASDPAIVGVVNLLKAP